MPPAGHWLTKLAEVVNLTTNGLRCQESSFLRTYSLRNTLRYGNSARVGLGRCKKCRADLMEPKGSSGMQIFLDECCEPR